MPYQGGRGPAAGTPSKAAFIWAIRQQESGGNYSAQNNIGALGAYQILTSNVGPWSRQALGHSLSIGQFLASPADQDAIADSVLGGYFDTYGPQGAAAAWYAGPGNAGSWNDTSPQSGGPSIADYVSSVMALAAQAPAGVSLPLSSTSGGTSGAPPSGGSGSGGGGDGGGGGGLLQIPTEITKFFSSATDHLTAAARFFGAFLLPSTWVRIGAGGLGTVCLIAGIVCLGLATKE